MALKVMVQYRDQPVVYDIAMQEDNVYHLRLHDAQQRSSDEYLPEKIVIRKKGMIWISDLEDYNELVSSLTAEISNFSNDQGNLKEV